MMERRSERTMRLRPVLFAVLAVLLPAQDADAIIAANLQARGGAERLARIRTFRMVGRSLVLPSQRRMSWMEEDRLPHAWRTEKTVEPGITGVDTFDGIQAWHLDSREFNKEARLLSLTEVQHLKDEDRYWDLLLTYKALGLEAKRLGRARVGGALVEKVRIELNPICDVIYYFDATTSLERRRDQEWREVGEELSISTYFEDYRRVGGLMFPFLIERQAAGRGARERLSIERLDLNPGLADARFGKPSN